MTNCWGIFLLIFVSENSLNMGIGLRILADHQLFYDAFDREETAAKMLEVLNRIELPNENFLESFYRLWNRLPEKEKIVKEKWSYFYDSSDDLSKEDSGITFCGPYDLEFILIFSGKSLLI